jgi:hypothetical protein
MDPRDKSRRSRQSRLGKVGKRGKGSPETGGGDEGRAQAPPSEDFAERRDIQTADEPAEEHERRHHDPRRDVESSQTS